MKYAYSMSGSHHAIVTPGVGKWKELDFSKDTLEKDVKWYTPQDGGEDPEKDGKATKRKIHFEKKKMVCFKLKPDREKMAQRMCISEHPFGTVKRALGAAYFLLKGRQKVGGEFAPMAMGYNISKAQNMFTFNELMALVSA